MSVSRHAAVALEMAQQAVELGGVAAGDAQLVVEAAGHVDRVGDRLELRGRGLERLVGARRREPDVDQRDEPAAGGARVDRGREAGDHAVAAQAAHAVGGGVRAEADGGAEVAERDPPVAHELAEDLAVCRIHAAIVAVGPVWLAKRLARAVPPAP